MAKKVVRYQLVRHKWPDEIEAEKKIKKRRIMTAAACIVFFVGGFISSSFWNSSTSAVNNEDFNKFFEIYNMMNTNFYFGKDVEDLKDSLISGAIDGMVSAGNDIHTTYLDTDQSERFTSSMEGSFVGIGVSYYEQSEGIFVIAKVYKGSPAEEAGLMAGDQLYGADGETFEGLSMDEIAEKIKGETGSSVKLEIIRDNEHITKKVNRATVNDSIFSEIKGKTAVMEINSIAETTGKEMGVHLKDIKDAGCTSLIIDMRNNGGGYLVAAQQVASYLLGEDKLIFKEETKDGSITEYKTLKDYEHYTFEKLIIIVDEGTASAAEVLTAAFKEELGATIVGVKTYGKGTVQVPVPFSDGSMFKYTMAEWITANGEKINGVGITPDVIVEQTEVMNMGLPKLDDEVSYEPDTVNVAAKSVQTYLKFLGYPVDRTDEYFSIQSGEALKQYQREEGLKADGKINKDVIKSLLSSASYQINSKLDLYDLQMKKAMEIANG